MKVLGVYPFSDQEVRIQPFFRYIESSLTSEIDHFLFIDENLTIKPKEVLEIELKNFNNSYQIIPLENYTRAQTIDHSIQYAKENEFDYIVIFNEGWEDNIDEMINIIQSQEFTNYSLVTSCRNSKDFSLGSLYNLLSNLLASLFTKTLVKETKGDSINILRTSDLEVNEIKSTDVDLFYFKILLRMILSGKSTLYTDVDNGLNYRSYVRLNTKRFFNIIFLLLFFKGRYKKL